MGKSKNYVKGSGGGRRRRMGGGERNQRRKINKGRGDVKGKGIEEECEVSRWRMNENKIGWEEQGVR